MQHGISSTKECFIKAFSYALLCSYTNEVIGMMNLELGNNNMNETKFISVDHCKCLGIHQFNVKRSNVVPHKIIHYKSTKSIFYEGWVSLIR